MADNGDFSEMTANWTRFSEYMYGEASDFSKIIVPKEGSELLYYDAFSVVTDLIVDYLNLGKHVWNSKATASIDGTLAFANKYGLLQLSQDISYFEYAAKLMTKSKKLYELFYNIHKLSSGDSIVGEQLIKGFETTPFKMGYDIKKGKPKAIIKADNLQQIIEYVFVNQMCKNDVVLRICKHCQNAFFAEHKRMEFCSPQCRNQFNVYKARGKKTD